VFVYIENLSNFFRGEGIMHIVRTLSILFSWLLLAALLQAGQPANPNEGDAPDLQEDIKKLTALGIPTEGDGLLDYFRKRTFVQVKPEDLEQLIAQLGSPHFQTREKALRELMKYEVVAKPALVHAMDNDNYEIQSRARLLLSVIEDKANPQVQGTVARVIAARKPPGACEVLLNFLPFAHESVIEEFRAAIPAVALDNGKPNPMLVEALEDKYAIKREIAGESLAKTGAVEHFPAVRKLLKDKNHQVQLRVAMALIRNKQTNAAQKAATREAIECLIDLMVHLSPEELWPAEYLLVRLAGENEPSVTLGDDEPSRKACHDAWKQWWTQHGGKIDVAVLDTDDERLGRLLIIYNTPNRFVNGQLQRGRKIVELDAGKKVRWEFVIETGNPVDIQGIGPRKLLVAEYNGRVAERDLDGRILVWEKYIQVLGGLQNNPVAVQRFPNGNTFIVTRNQFLEMDRAGNNVYTHNRNANDICMGGKLKNGTIVYVTSNGTLTYLDPRTNQVTRSINVGQVISYNGGMEILDNNNVLIPLYNENRVVEYDATGKKVWEANVNRPTTVTRLPNGHTVIGSLYSNTVIMVDQNNKQVWSQTFEGQVYQVRTR
jgi:hypothetical protein